MKLTPLGWLLALAPLLFPISCANGAERAPLSDSSLYQLESSWTNDAGKQMHLAALRGKVIVAAMFFANCEFACPMLVRDLKRIEAGLPREVRSRVGFVLVSFDSERDTPKELRAYRERMKLSMDRWTLLNGKPDDVLELAALIGVKYKQDLRGQFAHSNLLTVLNAEGEIIHQQIGLDQDAVPTVRIIQQASKAPARIPQMKH